MDISVAIKNIVEWETDAIVLNLFEGVTVPGGATGAVDAALNGQIRDLIAGGDFTGKFKEIAVLYPRGGISARRLLLVGLGKREEFTVDRVRQVSAAAARRARGLGAEQLATVVHGGGVGGLEVRAAAQAVVEGAVLGTYRFTPYKSGEDDDDNNELEGLTLVEFDAAKQTDVENGSNAGRIIAEAACLARDLASHPGNEMTPVILAGRAEAMARETGLRCEVFDDERIEGEGMRTIQAVAQGSAQPPRFIVLEHDGEDPEAAPAVLIGKGITFDSGGISIKGSEGMWDMKFDMGGAAAVIGAMQAVARLDLPVRTIGLVAASENMPGSRALKPGDIIRSMLGKTIEIRSTDAEGRLVLADAVAYAARYKPCAAIDLATLTGACIIALGHEASGLFSNDDALASEIAAAGERTGEIAWRLPILDGHREQMKSDIADLKNTGGGGGGAITGAAFIEAFVQDFPWAHLDIAGTAWAQKDLPHIPRGGTGVGVRLLVDLLRNKENAPEPL
ncbi:MAG: leucyl aminopeptidase [Gemmatimonadetes bacterium]|nr:leucyl aminopeptidase [Gemmatimonadota bacterium]